MSTDGKLNVVLFALTGFGNSVLNALLDDDRCRVSAVFTVKYKDPFPFYPEQQLGDLCAARDVSCHFNVKVGSPEGLALLRAYAPDLIVVATFKQILSGEVLSIPRLAAVHFHPSLLPRYRGPCPTNAALLHGDSATGVTAHYVTEGLDEGNSLFQRSTVIDETDNDGRLRKKLTLLAAKMVPELITMVSAQDTTGRKSAGSRACCGCATAEAGGRISGAGTRCGNGLPDDTGVQSPARHHHNIQ